MLRFSPMSSIVPPLFPTLHIMRFVAKCSKFQSVIVSRLESCRARRLCGRVNETEDVVQDVVAPAILLEVEGLSKAHGPL